jgi:glycerophosphoryl diester phosphodiesterase
MTEAPARPERIGHRGAPRERPENTLSSFLRAVERGADAVELDVHRTRDGVVVVHHDAVPRATNRSGVAADRPFAELDWDEVRRLRVGDEGIPRLDDVLNAIGGQVTVYVEIKGTGIEASVLPLVRAAGRLHAVHSFDHELIVRAARLAPDVPRGVLLDKGVRDPLTALRTAVERTHARDAWPHYSLVNTAFAQQARELGVRVIPWTVNDRRRARRLELFGVAGICTDDIRLLDNSSGTS